MIRDLSDIVTVAAMQRALMGLDHCRIGSADERAGAYAEVGIPTTEAARLDAEAWRTERMRRQMFQAQQITRAA